MFKNVHLVCYDKLSLKFYYKGTSLMLKYLFYTVIGFLLGCQTYQPENSELVKKVQLQLSKIEQSENYNSYIFVAKNQVIKSAQNLSLSTGKIDTPLYGMTLTIKDNIEVAEMPHSVGHKLLANYYPKNDAEVIKRLKSAGAIIIGKANMHELAYGITSNNAAFGAVANAYNKNKFAGGSSGGTATAIALGLADAGLGTDTGGSSRIPAALNGIVGFRPTTGRYPNDGLSLISTTRDTVGPMAKDVATVARLDQVLANDKSIKIKLNSKSLRLGVPRNYFYENLSTDVAAGIEIALKELAAAGIELVEVDVINVASLNEKISFPVVLYETNQLLPKLLKRVSPQLSLEDFIAGISSPDVKGIITNITQQPIPKTVYLDAINNFRPQLQSTYKQYFQLNQLDALIVPATPLAAQDIIGSDETVMLNGKAVPTFPTFIHNLDPSSNAGIPSLVIPMGKNTEGLPIALQLDGPVNSDRKLLAIGELIEKIIKQSIK